MKVLIEGWRFYSHSYSLVAMWHALALQDCGVEVGWRDMPPLDPKWRQKRGLLSVAQEERIAGLPCFAEPDVVFRHYLPIDVLPAPSDEGQLFVFVTADYGWLPRRMIRAGKPLSELVEPTAQFVTPSEFSKAGLIRSGAAAVVVVPHGTSDTFSRRPLSISEGTNSAAVGTPAILGNLGNLAGSYVDPGDRSAIGQAFPLDRRDIRLGPQGLDFQRRQDRILGNRPTLLNVSDMSRRKGLDVLLRAFAGLLRHRPASLVLKGLGDFSRRHYLSTLRDLPQADRAFVAPHIRFIGDELNIEAMADLYRSADLYVSPYRAEAFNMPVAEALACGLPVVCTAGGPTDEFASGARFIKSSVVTRGIDIEETILEPDPDDTLAAILQILSPGAKVCTEEYRHRTWAQVGEELSSLFSHTELSQPDHETSGPVVSAPTNPAA